MSTEVIELRGLSPEEVAERLAREGPNELTASKRQTLVASALALTREPMTLLLLACGGIYLTLGDRQDALILLGFVVFIVGITLVEERKTERALEALRDMASPRALVIRSGLRERIAGREVVRDDLVVLSEGDRVPADATLLSLSHLAVDESLMTGESAAVHKVPWDGAMPVARPGGDGLPFVYAGTLVVAGSAVARVHATGDRTEVGRIGRSLAPEREQVTPLRHETARLVRKLAWVSGALSLLVAVVYGASRGSWLGGLLAGLTLAMAILPNEIPVVITIFLALGAWRLSRRRVLTRRVTALETIGSATVLCVDKTGTLTHNRMSVRKISVAGDVFDVERLASEALPEAFHETVELSILASRPDPFDPMERAFKRLGEEYLGGTEHLHPDWELVREYPLSRELLAVTQVWRSPGRPELIVATKGAPEAVVDLCHLDDEARGRVARSVEQLADEGLRVLAVARGRPVPSLPERAHEVDFDFAGLVGLADPIRADVPAAIAECNAAGIRVVMITGDYPATARSVAHRIGLDGLRSVVTGEVMSQMSDDELRARVQRTSVFARVLPEQKLRIVQALQAAGDIVAMTGDGVNDAPALKAADIGVAMGARGTDVAREAATLVLLDDDFSSLVQAVRSGRRIVDNLRKALAYILAVHLPIVGLTLVPVFAGWPLVLLPIHIAFLHLVIDPACSVVIEAQPEEADLMTRPPRRAGSPVFGSGLLTISLLQGAAGLLVVVGVYGLALHLGRAEAAARAMAFLTLMGVNLGLIFTNRSWSRTIFGSPLRDATLWIVTVGALSFLAAVLYVPALARFFRFASPAPLDVALCVSGVLAGITWFEIAKLLLARASRRAKNAPGRSKRADRDLRLREAP